MLPSPAQQAGVVFAVVLPLRRRDVKFVQLAISACRETLAVKHACVIQGIFAQPALVPKPFVRLAATTLSLVVLVKHLRV